MGCTTCSGNPNTWCTQCMPAEDTWVAPVDKLPDVFMGDRDHMYLLPNGDLFILSPDRTRWIKVNGQGGGATYDDTKIINRLKALEGKTDNFISTVGVSRNGNRVKLTYTLVDGTIKEVEFEDKDTVALAYDDSALKARVKALEDKPDNDKQTLTLEGKKLSISNGNSVMLPNDTIGGGDNLICNSGFPNSTDGWGYWSSNQKNGKLSLVKHQFYYNNTENMFVLSNNTQDSVPASSIRFKVKRNTNYSLNLASFATGNIKGVTLYFLGRKNGEKQPFTNVVTIKDTNSSPSTTGIYNFITTFNTGESDEGYIRIDNKGTNNSSESFLFFSEVDVYEGTSPRAYTPSVKCALDSLNNKEDKDKQTLTLNNNVLSISNGNSVTLPAQGVSTQDFNNLKNEYNQLKDAFTALLQNLKDSGAWNQTGNTIFEGSLRPDRNIATGNINLFGGTVDGSAFIRTNNGKTENDLAGGIN